MNKTRLIVVRHGNTFNAGDLIRRVGAATDIPLTEKGVAQGSAVGKALKAAGIEVDKIFSAPLLRTKRSAQEIAASYPGTEICEEKFLTELDYGIDDGAAEDDVVLRLGIVESAASINAATSLDDLRSAGKEALRRWDKEAVLPRAWEHLKDDVADRSVQWRKFGAMVSEKFASKTVVAVTSNGIARFSTALLDENSRLPESLKLATGAYGIYVCDNGKWVCEAWNVRPEL